MGETSHHVFNSKQLAEDMKDVVLEDDECLALHDVVSLFKNTHINMTLDIIRDKLAKDPNLNKRN